MADVPLLHSQHCPIRCRPRSRCCRRAEQEQFYRSAIKMIRGLQESGTLPISRMCVRCRYFDPFRYPDSPTPHHCHLVGAPFADRHLRIDCPEQEFNEPRGAGGPVGALLHPQGRRRPHDGDQSDSSAGSCRVCRSAGLADGGILEVVRLVLALTDREAREILLHQRCAAPRPRRRFASPASALQFEFAPLRVPTARHAHFDRSLRECGAQRARRRRRA